MLGADLTHLRAACRAVQHAAPLLAPGPLPPPRLWPAQQLDMQNARLSFSSKTMIKGVALITGLMTPSEHQELQ